MLLDLLHTLNHFVSPLPEEYSEFKALLAEVFPRLIDTKLMASNPPFREGSPTLPWEASKPDWVRRFKRLKVFVPIATKALRLQMLC